MERHGRSEGINVWEQPLFGAAGGVSLHKSIKKFQLVLAKNLTVFICVAKHPSPDQTIMTAGRQWSSKLNTPGIRAQFVQIIALASSWMDLQRPGAAPGGNLSLPQKVSQTPHDVSITCRVTVSDPV